jgi:hypothetical protein
MTELSRKKISLNNGEVRVEQNQQKSGGAVEELIQSLADADTDEVNEISTALARLGSEAIPILLRFTRSENPRIGHAAITAICKMANPGPEASARLLELARNRSHPLSTRALFALGIVAEARKEIIEVLTSELDSNSEVRSSIAATALGDLGGRAVSAVPALRRLLREKDSANAAIALGNIAPPDEELAVQLASEMSSSKMTLSPLRGICGEALCKLPLATKKIEPYAIQTLENLRKFIHHYYARSAAKRKPPLRGTSLSSKIRHIKIHTALKYSSSHCPPIGIWPELVFEPQHAYAIIALCRLDCPSRRGMEAVLESIEYGPAPCRKAVLDAIRKGSETSPWVARKLGKLAASWSKEKREAALTALWAVGEHAEPAAPILLKLARRNPSCRCRAFLILSQCGRYLEEVLEYIAAELRAGSYTPGFIRNLKGKAEPLQPLLIDLLSHTDSTGKQAALAAAGEMTDPGEGLLELVDSLTEARSTCSGAVKALVAWGRRRQAADRVISTIISDLQSKDPEIRDPALDLVEILGEYAKPAIPVLKKLADQGNDRALKVMFSLGSAAGEIAPFLIEKIKPVLLEDLRGDEICLDTDPFHYLCKLGLHAAGAVPALVEALEYEDYFYSEFAPTIRLECVRTLGEIGPAAKEAVPAIVNYISGRSGMGRYFPHHDITTNLQIAVQALEKIGHFTPEVQDRLMQELQEGVATERHIAARAAFVLASKLLIKEGSSKELGQESLELSAFEGRRRLMAVELMVKDHVDLHREFDSAMLQVLVRMKSAEFCREGEEEQLAGKVKGYTDAQDAGRIAPLPKEFQSDTALLRPSVTVRNLKLSEASMNSIERIGEVVLNSCVQGEQSANDLEQLKSGLVDRFNQVAGEHIAAKVISKRAAEAKDQNSLFASLLTASCRGWSKKAVAQLKVEIRKLIPFFPAKSGSSSSRIPVILDKNGAVKDRLNAASGYYRNIIEPEVEVMLSRLGMSSAEINKATKQLALALGVRGVEKELQQVVALEEKLERRQDPAAPVGLIFQPSRGLLAELSAYICDTCWLVEEGITEKYPNLVFVAFNLQPQMVLPGADRTPFMGGSLVLSTKDRAGKPVMVVRGLNPHEDLLRAVSVSSLCEEYFDYLAGIGRLAGVKSVVISDDPCCGRAQTNRPPVNGYIKSRYESARVISLQGNSEVIFYHRKLDRCLVVRDLA